MSQQSIMVNLASDLELEPSINEKELPLLDIDSLINKIQQNLKANASNETALNPTLDLLNKAYNKKINP